jgi:hypothetical protein
LRLAPIPSAGLDAGFDGDAVVAGAVVAPAAVVAALAAGGVPVSAPGVVGAGCEQAARTADVERSAA